MTGLLKLQKSYFSAHHTSLRVGDWQLTGFRLTANPFQTRFETLIESGKVWIYESICVLIREKLERPKANLRDVDDILAVNPMRPIKGRPVAIWISRWNAFRERSRLTIVIFWVEKLMLTGCNPASPYFDAVEWSPGPFLLCYCLLPSGLAFYLKTRTSERFHKASTLSTRSGRWQGWRRHDPWEEFGAVWTEKSLIANIINNQLWIDRWVDRHTQTLRDGWEP